jgi:antitoxin component of MazEF toxin-antitoxin module
VITKLTPSANGYALVIDKTLLDKLEIGPDTELEMTTDGKRLIVEPVRARSARPAQQPGRGLPEQPATRPDDEPSRRFGFPKKQPW